MGSVQIQGVFKVVDTSLLEDYRLLEIRGKGTSITLSILYLRVKILCTINDIWCNNSPFLHLFCTGVRLKNRESILYFVIQFFV